MSFLSQAFQATTAENQSSIISFANSSTEPLSFTTPGALNFEGAWVSGANYSSIQVSILSNTHCFLYVEQSFFPDGRDPIQTFNYFYDSTGYELVTRFAYITCPFVRVVVANESAGNTLFFLSTKLTASASSTVNISNFPATQTVSGSVLSLGTLPNGTTQSSIKLNTNGALITTSTATGASAASVTAWGQDALGASYPLPLTTGGAEIAMSITDPLPTGTNTIGAVKLEGTFDRGIIGIETLNPTVYSFTGGEVGQNPVALVTTMDARQGGASTTICGLSEEDREFEFISCIKTGDNGIGPINALHTYVDNLPAVQDISGTVTVASITEPLPTGANTIGSVKLVGTNDRGVDVLTLNPTVYSFTGGEVGQNAVALVTTTDAKAGGASTAICALDVTGTGEAEFLSCSQIQLTDIHSVNSLHTYVDNVPVVQVVAGRETPYIGFATPETNIPQVYADGIPGINVTGGWLYSSTQVGVAPFTGSSNKINWYLYNSATPDTDFSVSQLSNVYAVINQKSTLGTQAQLPFFTIYTRPDSGVNNGGTFFKNRLTFGGQSFAGTMGQMLLFTGDDPVDIHPEITGVSRLRLQYNTVASTTTFQAAQGESIYLATLQTDSDPKPNGTRNFVFSEFSMIWSQAPVVIPISQSQVQVFDKALNASAATLVTDLSGITITANKLQVGGTVAVSNFPATQPVSGSVSVSNLPATQAVSGSVSITNLPATQPISGTVAISNFPEGGSNVTIVSPLPTGTNAIGSVTVSNFPPGGSEVSVSNFPATQPVSGTFWQTTQPVSGTVAISNFPAGGSNVTVVSALPAGSNNIGSVNCNGFDNINSQYTPIPIVSEDYERYADKYVSVLPKNTRKIYGQDGNYTLNTSWSTSVGEYEPQGSKIIVLLKCSEVIGPGTASIAVQIALNGGEWFNSPYVFNLTTSSDRSQMLICDMNVPRIRLANINTDQTGTGLIGVSFAYIMSLF
jgi:hypothetical protein